MSTGQSFSTADLVGLLDLERIEANLFRARHGPGSHVFGGQVLAQAIIAGQRTVENRALHSAHAYFLRPGDSTRPLLLEVDRIRDGRSFATRRVVAIQNGRAIFSLSASYQAEESGLEHAFPKPAVAPPEELEEDLEVYRRLAEADPRVHRFLFRFETIDSRQVEGIHMFPREGREPLTPSKNTWMRIKGPMPEVGGVGSPIHRALLAYLSDMDFLAVSLLPHGPSLDGASLQVTSLDHAIWFHRPMRVDEWLLFSKESQWAGGARGLVRGHFFDRDGAIVASVSQECLIRRRPERPAAG